jgi:proline racemase
MNWKPPDHWLQVTAVDAHTGGEPLRIYTEGYPQLAGDSILAKRRYAIENYDHIRTATMWEPRGHADMYGCVITEPVTTDGDFGVLFLHNEGYSSMCGHGIIAVTKVVLETGLVNLDRNKVSVNIDTPAGRVTAFPHWNNDQVAAVSFLNVPAYVYALDQVINLPELGEIKYDIAFGGAYYAFVNADSVRVRLDQSGFRRLIELGSLIKEKVMAQQKITHPFEEDLGFLYGVIFVGEAYEKENHSRNVCIFADGEVDRSPTGTGVSARSALHFARGEIGIGETIVVESILGSLFKVEVSGETRFGPYRAVIPRVTGEAHICGINKMLIDPDDPLRNGFMLR